MMNVIIFCFGPFFALLSPKSQKMSKEKKEKRAWRYHHFTHVYKNYYHMMYGS